MGVEGRAPVASMIPEALKSRLTLKLGAGAIVLAGTLVGWFEGYHNVPYPDSGGVMTVCEGHTGPDVIPGKTYTPGECATLKNRDLVRADADVSRLVRVPLTTAQRAALIDFVYNVGAGNLAHSTLLKKLNAGDYDGACSEYRRWVFANGKRLRGLENRREAEAWLCSMS
jgi:lysozyme